MSRVAKAAITLPSGVEAKVDGKRLTIKGGKGAMDLLVHDRVAVNIDGSTLSVAPANEAAAKNGAWAMAGTTRALINNMVVGVSQGWTRKLQLVGVGYRAQAKGRVLGLSLGFSHPVEYPVPEGINVDTPTQTEILVSGFDKQKVGQVAAEIRAYRPPEPYKGKGVRYSDEQVVRKETKKK
ncbi:MAG: 50S ribosomal protein L6 [Gammaproteobacteria bacterium RIFOXYA12_FULL_61_12]|nr:MAG: 50S ribosomal protein L6 [Gammaproteobacteria bacterium RIFOXYD12_FULL_61_37]OGT90491.1 MAG: 50S ribosomal protein L6 [Gammaproteobacteria bacterium RIFOXYA12_FULL_61_12]